MSEIVTSRFVRKQIPLLVSLMLIGITSLNAEKDKELSALLSESFLSNQIEAMESCVEVTFHPSMVSMVEHYALSEATPELLSRTELYFPLFEEVLAAHGMPDDLKYLAVIESHLRPKAYSYRGAAGMWQFMRGTGRMMGLEINHAIDQRLDAWASTEAAVRYLKYLHDMYGDWTLALAAYNCGPGNVNKAMRRSGSTSYWKMRNYLPRETRNYLPKFIATSYFLKSHHIYNIPFQPMNYKGLSVVKLYEQSSLKEVAALSGMEYIDLIEFNPAYRNEKIPSSLIGMNVLMPDGYAQRYTEAFHYAHPERKQPTVINASSAASGRRASHEVMSFRAIETVEEVIHRHVVVSGDNLYNIARDLGVSVGQLKRQNGLRSSLIKPGQKLQIKKRENMIRYIPVVSIPEAITSEKPSGDLMSLGGSILDRAMQSALHRGHIEGPRVDFFSFEKLHEKRRAFAQERLLARQ